MKIKQKLIVLSLASGLLAGCVSTAPEVGSSATVNIPLAPLAPSAEELKKEQKIVLLPFEISEELQSAVASTGYASLEQALMQSGNIVIERDIAAKMRDELLVAEKTGRYRTSGLQAADIAVMVKIVSADIGSSFSERDTWVDKKGKQHTSPAECSFRGKTKMHVRAYHLPEMRQIGSFEFDGSASSSTETNNSKCPISVGQAEGLLSSATVTAVRENQFKLLNELVPPYFVIERRQIPGDKNNALFRTTLSNANGAKEGTKVNFYRRELKTNPLTEEQFVEEILLTSGQITSDIDANGSYVLVKKADEINKLMLGDVIKVEHDRCPQGYYSLLGSCHKNLNLF